LTIPRWYECGSRRTLSVGDLEPPVMHSLSMLGVLIAGIGGFIFVSNWDTRRGGRRRMIDLLVFILVGAGIALFVVGIFQ
jgi:hypothetical protein